MNRYIYILSVSVCVYFCVAEFRQPHRICSGREMQVKWNSHVQTARIMIPWRTEKAGFTKKKKKQKKLKHIITKKTTGREESPKNKKRTRKNCMFPSVFLVFFVGVGFAFCFFLFIFFLVFVFLVLLFALFFFLKSSILCVAGVIRLGSAMPCYDFNPLTVQGFSWTNYGHCMWLLVLK